MDEIVSPENMRAAWQWLKSRRQETHPNNDYWDLRFHIETVEPEILKALKEGDYWFSPCRAAHGRLVWSAQDALVLKAVTLVLSRRLAPTISETCRHATGNGGLKGAVRDLGAVVNRYRYVCRSDVNSYYASIQHNILKKQLRKLIHDERVLTLIDRMLDRLDDVGGELYWVDQGITKGNPLSPLLDAIYLAELDQRLETYCKERGLFYARFMDDWIVLCRSRNELRTAVRIMNEVLSALKMTKHPFKTYIGRIKANGFDFLGYRFLQHPFHQIRLAWKTWANHQLKRTQLYEQGASSGRIEAYEKRWWQWAKGGLGLQEHEINFLRPTDLPVFG